MNSLLAVEQGNLSPIKTGEDSMSGILSEPPIVAKVRIPLKLTAYTPILVQNANGVKRIEHKVLAPLAYNLRATINRSNHFYLSDWHIETVPMQWEKDQKMWKAELKFYKRYGQEQELEEFIGTMPIAGKLLGHDQDKLFVLETKGRLEFQNKRGNPVLTVEAGQFFIEQKGNVAKRDR